jgi:methyltransferase (TIGR00027 family)
VFVCQGRAVADGRLSVGTFADPVAARLLTRDELDLVLAARGDGLPEDGRLRFAVQSVRACAEVVVPRTVRLDELLAQRLSEEPGAQVVLLGAGLDARPWRLAALAGSMVLSVDHPASQAELRRRAHALAAPACDLRLVPVDLVTDPLEPALAAAGHDPSRPTVWLWEGVVPYLDRTAVESTVAAVAGASALGSALLASYQAPSVTALAGRWASAVLTRLAGADNPLSDEPWRSTWSPARFTALLDRHGFGVASDESLLQVARRIGSPTGRSRSLANGRVSLAPRARE